MASFPPPPSPTLPITTTTTTFLSSTQLRGIADKLSSSDDRQKYQQVITLSSTIQTKLNQIRLDRMNAISFNTKQTTAIVERNSCDRQHSTFSEDLDKEELITETAAKVKGISKTTQGDVDPYQQCSALSITTGMTAPLPPLPLSPPLPQTYLVERRDSAVEIIQQKSVTSPSQSSAAPSLDFVDQYTDKALPIPKSDSNKYDSIFDTTSYYYEEQQKVPMDWEKDQPLPPPYLPPKSIKPTFTDHLGLPSPSSLAPPGNIAFENVGNYHNLNINYTDPSFLLITPPESPRYIDCLSAPPTPSTPLYKEQHPLPLPPIIHCQRKINGFLGFLTRTYQINEIISSRVLISSLGLFNAMDSSTGLEKAVLKVTMTSSQVKAMDLEDTLDRMMVELFGFTFYASVKRSPNVKRPTREDPQCLVISDHLVSDALDYWIHHQRDGLPVLSYATHILRDSVKIYVVYDRTLLIRDPY